MDEKFFAARRSELTALAKERGVDLSEALQSFEEADDIQILAYLATLLELDVPQVFEPETSIEEVERYSRGLREAQIAEFDLQRAEAERQLRNLPQDIKFKLAAQLEEAAAALRKG
jgi:hypothetical protein